MRIFSICVEDDRLTGPLCSMIIAADADRARVLAERKLQSSLHYSAIDVGENGRVLFRLER